MTQDPIKSNEMKALIDVIVKEVLFKIGECQQIVLIEGVNYPQTWLDEMGQDHLLKWCQVDAIDTLKETDMTELWLPELTIKHVMAVINASPFDRVSEVLFKALIHGISVNVHESSIELLGSTHVENPLMQRFYKAYDLLIKSGLKVSKNKGTKEENGAVIEEAKTNKTIVYEERLLTESQLIALRDQGVQTIRLSKETLLTPAAMDFMRINAINMDRM